MNGVSVDWSELNDTCMHASFNSSRFSSRLKHKTSTQMDSPAKHISGVHKYNIFRKMSYTFSISFARDAWILKTEDI